jgi:translation initiation factor 2B subunit (eIF-2B alpha/beta/delta family)
MGTLALAVAASEFGIPVLAVAETSKLLPHAVLPEEDRHRNPNEVWDGAPAGVTVRNRYFEKVPLKHFRAFAIEEGTVDAKGIARRTERAGPGLERLAGLLAR